jgi:hypothetical protein
MLHAVDLDTQERFTFLEGDLAWKELIDNATLLVGHNIIDFDNSALKQLFGYDIPKSVTIRDTLIMSQVLNYERFGKEGHSLAVWGEFLGYPKLEFEDFSEYTAEMQEYCERDVDLNIKVYEILDREVKALRARNPNIATYLRAEHYAAQWSARAKLTGWKVDRAKAEELFEELDNELRATVAKLEPTLGWKAVIVDRVTPAKSAAAKTIEECGNIEDVHGKVYEGEAIVKRPKYIKNGCYDSHTARWFSVDPLEGLMEEEALVQGAFCRVEFEPLKLSSHEDVKKFLYRNKWQPTEWNMKVDPVSGRKVRSSPKITEDSIEFMGGDGKLYLDYLTVKSRYGILNTWLNVMTEEDRLHGDMMLVGTPSMRARHSIIVNVPNADAVYGKEMRKLFICPEGWTMIGADSAGNQARGLAHYLGDEEFIDVILNKDIHTYDADKLTEALSQMLADASDNSTKNIVDFHARNLRTTFENSLKSYKEAYETAVDMEVKEKALKGIKATEASIERLDREGYFVQRNSAKRVLYAFLFGASGAKLWSYIFGNLDKDRGSELKTNFISAIPGFKKLVDRLEAIFDQTKKRGSGYIPSIAGNRLYVDSKHKLLVYLLQSLEKITCSTALMLTVQRLEEAGIPYEPLIYYHDEIDFIVPTAHAKEAASIAAIAFKDGPAMYGIKIMDGEAKIGKNWYEVH